MANVRVDFNKVLKDIKPLHGVNGGPLTGNLRTDAKAYFKDAGIPFARLHDVEYPYGRGEFVDIPCIFKDFSADENDPLNYNFTCTDAYIKAIIECNTSVIFRLGVSIEHSPVKLHVYPPEDFDKWARICEHIIRHYNEGWAEGFHYDIKYWEIWNEPNHNYDQTMWIGTAQDFAHLYATAATHLKKCFPDLYIGGPAFSHLSQKFEEEFFTELTKDGAHPPMDFFSWHAYSDTVDEMVRRSRQARKNLEDFGYSEVKLGLFDEWNYIKSWKDTAQVATVVNTYIAGAFNLAVMCAMQNEFCTGMAYYSLTAIDSMWNSLLERENVTSDFGKTKKLIPKKGYYAFKAFNELYKLKNQTEFETDDNRIYGLSASDGERSVAIIDYFADEAEEPKDKEISISIKGAENKKCNLYLYDESHNNKKMAEFCDNEFTYVLKPNTFIMLEYVSKDFISSNAPKDIVD